jgi:hypothetical protein
MVAKIKTRSSIARALHYNEHKVQKGAAECIFAGNFLGEANEMNFYQKLERFEKLIVLNEWVKTNSLHISLNFDPSDNLDKDKLITIATQYMERLGFAEQPGKWGHFFNELNVTFPHEERLLKNDYSINPQTTTI